VLAALDGGRLDITELHRFPNVPIRVDGSLRWDMHAIWRGITDGLEAASGHQLASIGVDTWGCDYGLIDRSGDLVELPYHYRDHRTDGVMARVFDQVGRARIYDTTGVQCLPFNTLYQLEVAGTRSPTPTPC
jgi:rhamnulokinase